MARELYSVIVGTGSCIPEKTVPNEDFLGHRFFSDYGQPLDPADNPAIISKFRDITEIAERRYVTDELVTSDIAWEAARKALASAGVDPESLDYLVVAHNFGDVRADNRRSDFVPSLAARVKQRLGIVNPWCVAYDLPFGCPGWLQAVIQADYFLRSGDAKRALVVGAETLSRVSDPHDRDSMIYSDGAGAVVIEAQRNREPVGILAHAARSDTLEHARLLQMGVSYDPEFEDRRLFLKMQGRKLYEYALTTVPGVVRQSLERAGLTLADVRKVLIHQANGKMDEAILKRLFKLYGVQEIPAEIMPMTISRLGNSSVATLPTLLDLIRRGELDGHRLGSGDILVFASVGAGMNINSVVYRCP
ncbi:MAG: ketoacyl-ACP synthase III [Deltaproteobacteria bacterium]|nr:ketoacyl-ACP synthase III [Deltaproteobacteria bacterium]